MRTLLALCLMTSAAAWAVADHDQKSADKSDEKPVLIKLNQGGVSAQFPSEPLVSSENQDTPAGKMTIQIASWKLEDAELQLAWSKLPIEPDQFNPQKILDSSAFGALNSANGTIIEIRRTEFGPNKLPAREMTYELPEGLQAKHLIVLSGNRLNQAVATGPKKFVEGEQSQAFFKSVNIGN